EGWLQLCHDNRTKILHGIIPYLSESNREAVDKFTLGTGTSGHQREAYYVGWEFVATQLKKGISFPQLVRINKKDILDYVKKILKSLLWEKKGRKIKKKGIMKKGSP